MPSILPPRVNPATTAPNANRSPSPLRGGVRGGGTTTSMIPPLKNVSRETVMRSAPFAGISAPAMRVRAKSATHTADRQPPCQRPSFLPLATLIAPVSPHVGDRRFSPWRPSSLPSATAILRVSDIILCIGEPCSTVVRARRCALAVLVPGIGETHALCSNPPRAIAIPAHLQSPGKTAAPFLPPTLPRLTPFMTRRHATPPRAQRDSRQRCACADDPSQGSLQGLPARAASAARPRRAVWWPLATGPGY
jgi:hypothetical protein